MGRPIVVCALTSSLLLWSVESSAAPGTHAPIVSTWDTGASSVSASFNAGLFPGGHLYFGSYTSSFSSTSGKVSAQFGVHYVNYLQGAGLPAANGASGTAAFVFSAPVLGRYDRGLPRLALGFYVGLAPTLLVSGERNYLWIPLTTGLAAPFAPAPFVSVVPSFEVGGGATLDTVIRAPEFKPSDVATAVGPDGTIRFTQADIERLVAESVKYEVGAAVSLRGGVGVVFHLGERVDVGADVGLGNVGNLSSGALAVFMGGKLQLHWDSVVPAVLPAKTRLERESCEDV